MALIQFAYMSQFPHLCCLVFSLCLIHVYWHHSMPLYAFILLYIFFNPLGWFLLPHVSIQLFRYLFAAPFFIIIRCTPLFIIDFCASVVFLTFAFFPISFIFVVSDIFYYFPCLAYIHIVAYFVSLHEPLYLLIKRGVHFAFQYFPGF